MTDHSGGAIGIIAGSPTISGCVFLGNGAIDGGAIVVQRYGSTLVPQVIITNCLFQDNSCSGGGDGGGVFVGDSEACIANSVFEGNSARGGGAVYHQFGDLQLINCLVIGNTASLRGGGLGFGHGTQTVLNCTISNNVVSGTYPETPHDGGGVVCQDDATLTNCILWNNSAEVGQELSVWAWPGSPPATLTVSYCDVDGGQSAVRVVAGNTLNWGPGNIDAAPHFADPLAGDYHLLLDSPCINAGDNSAVVVGTDLDGNARIIGGVVDMGAYEADGPREVAIDVKPGSYPNSINLGSHGLIPVAVFSDAGFDATTVNPERVELAGAGVAVRGNGKKYMAHEEDVNQDGLTDLVVQVETENLDPGQLQDGYAIIGGWTYDGVLFIGQDEIIIVPPEN